MTRPATLALLALAAALAACGGAAEDAKTPDLSNEDLATPDRAYAAVGRAEGELALALGAGPGGNKDERFAQPASPPPAPPPAEPSPPPPPPPPPVVTQAAAPPADAAARSRAEEHDAKQKSTPAAGASPCLTICAAFLSMERATDHLCALTGAADAHCMDARARVESVSKRVRAACPACAG